MNKSDIEQFLDSMDNGAREAFISMPRENQLLVLFSIEMSNSNRLAKVEREQIEFKKDVREYRMKREKREDNGDTDIMNTTQKILNAIADAKAKEFNWGIYFRDRVLPSILAPGILVLLYLIFSQIKP